MRLKQFFHKIKIGFVRKMGNSIPHISDAKIYGNRGEDAFLPLIRSHFPHCAIKKNVAVYSSEGTAEIDFLLLYQNKLFAIEVKRWKGVLTERKDRILQKKTDPWTGAINCTYHRSPFKQLGRAIYLLRRQFPDHAWINPIIFFEDADRISISSKHVWFDNIDELVSYIQNCGRESEGTNAESFFEKCIPADCLYANSDMNSLNCIILEDSLRFPTKQTLLSRKDISSIDMIHHWSYDDLYVRLKNGTVRHFQSENATIQVMVNGHIYNYAISKLDRIQLGNMYPASY